MIEFFRSAWQFRSGRLALITMSVGILALSLSLVGVIMGHWVTAIVCALLGLGEAAEVIFVHCPNWEQQIDRGERMS